MANELKTNEELKSLFSKGMVPTAENFGDLIDVATSQEALNTKAKKLEKALNTKAGILEKALNDKAAEIEKTTNGLNTKDTELDGKITGLSGSLDKFIALVTGMLSKEEAKVKDIDHKVEEAMPIGAIIAYGGNGIPAGWLLCDGQPIPEKHKDLREKIGMNTPNLKRKFIVGADPEKLESDTFDYISGSKGGEEKHQLTEDEMPSHSHTINDPGHNHAPDGTYSYLVSIGGKNTSTEFDDKTGDHNNEIDLINAKAIKTSTTGITINNSGGGVSHNNMPPYYALTYIIKC